MNELVIAGVDGTAESLEALDVAVDEAVLRGCPLRIASARDFPPQTPESPAMVVERAVAHARQRSGTVVIQRKYARDRPGPFLARMTPQAAVLVVGSRGLEGLAALRAGSVSLYVAGHAACPVLVVRTGSTLMRAPENPGTIVVGLDPKHLVQEAIRFAFEEAVLREVDVSLVLAVPHTSGAESGLPEQVAFDWQPRYPQVKIWTNLVEELRPADALVAASEEAGLLVVGTRARHDHVGRVDHAAVRHAFCPVAVVPAARS